ncbi:23S rRNA pseudouridine(2604) synthase RluF [Lentisphaera profundi]|uniref:Pseudouridine synthase n=1 Tax=Lentisphaera profundi TaxID=1658616 RepID=A0ABY7VYQ5_9BACT|nr:23S rRNA pseudouridine(2604) synthase RluF [Lentisphaera profundi]WDE98399.1 23S rRNA pseudouridine(2604) synthase RluF [Lentisphaera profundi]
MRLNKFISDSGFCSRREADKLIEEGRVLVNGRRCVTGQQINDDDFVEADGQKIKVKRQKERVYLAFNKPEGITCTTENSVRGNIVDFIQYPEKIFPIGRLDKFSNGLIFMTNDGDIVNKILRAGNDHEKEYLVLVDRPIKDDFIRNMSNGVPILGTVTNKCKVNKEANCVFRITLTQGLNRQIRRMCEYLGYKVMGLQRTRIMNVPLGKLKIGTWRHLSPAEMEEINKMISGSSNTQEASRDQNKGRGAAPSSSRGKEYRPSKASHGSTPSAKKYSSSKKRPSATKSGRGSSSSASKKKGSAPKRGRR